MRLLYRDVDRLPYLHALKQAAQKRDLDLELVRHEQAGSEDWSARLNRGEVEAIAENYWALQRFRATGFPYATIGSAAHDWVEVLLVKPGIDSIAGLRGKRLAVRETGPQALFPTVVLERLGLLDAVEQVVLSEKSTGRWGHYKAVTEGDCDAAFMLPSYAAPALAAGLIAIPYPAFAFDGAHIIPTTTDDFVKREPALIAALVGAMFDACASIRATPERMIELVKTCLDDLREHFTLDTDDQIRRFSAQQSAEIAANPLPTADGIRNAYDVAHVRYKELDGYNPLEMWDLSFARAAMRDRREVKA